ncbi:hypothetical protein DL96DRAFT_900431 [Flagelloscypha sp. PMI_526]|nr:hypothetical protein DL96DRAFT_900431 [Flagelloscypha sp. PMI_526]
MNLPQELVGLVCSFSDSPTLASICLTNKAFYLDACAALYLELTFSMADAVDGFLLCARDRLNLVKHLSLRIPSFPAHELEVWKRFLVAIRQDSDLITLRITSPPTHTVTFPGIQELAGDLLSIPSLKYVAAATSVVSTITAIRCPALRELEIRQSEELEKLDDKELDKCIHGERQRLNTLIFGGYNRSPRLLDNVFNLNDLKRLALAFPSKIITTTCRTLTELAIWVHRNAAETAYLTEFRQIALPNLQAFALFITVVKELISYGKHATRWSQLLSLYLGRNFENFDSTCTEVIPPQF